MILDEGMTLYGKNDVFFPGKEFYSSDPLPGDWIGLITDKTVLENSGISHESNDDEEKLAATKERSLDLEDLLNELEKEEEVNLD